MSTPAHIDSKTIAQTDGARSSRVPIPLPNDPYMAVRQTYLATITDSESEPFEDFRETYIPQPLPIASSPIPPLDDPYLIVGQAHTTATIDTESEPEEAPSKTEELQPLAVRTKPPSSDHTPTSSNPTLVSPLTDEEFEASEPSTTRITSSNSTAPLNSTTPLSPDHPLTQTAPTPTLSRPLYYRRTACMAMRTQPTLPPGFSARLTEAIALSPSSFRSEELEDEGPDSEGYEAAPEGQQQQVTPVEVTTADRPLGLGYGAARRRALEIAEEITPSTFEIRHSSRACALAIITIRGEYMLPRDGDPLDILCENKPGIIELKPVRVIEAERRTVGKRFERCLRVEWNNSEVNWQTMARMCIIELKPVRVIQTDRRLFGKRYERCLLVEWNNSEINWQTLARMRRDFPLFDTQVILPVADTPAENHDGWIVVVLGGDDLSSIDDDGGCRAALEADAFLAAGDELCICHH
ncbi:hypothetical protein Tco_1493409 [Tanacetum coccineum]